MDYRPFMSAIYLLILFVYIHQQYQSNNHYFLREGEGAIIERNNFGEKTKIVGSEMG